MTEECMGTEWGQGGVGEEPMARSWADSWFIWDPNLRKLDNLDAGGFRKLSWPKGSPRGQGQGQSSSCFQHTQDQKFLFCSLAVKQPGST